MRWHPNITGFLIFVVPIFLSAVGAPTEEGEGKLFLQLREERKMRESADLRIKELESDQLRTERQFDTIRAAFAELFLENRELKSESRTLRLQAGQLVLNEKPAGAAEAEKLDDRLYAILRHRREAEQELRELQVQLQTLLELEDESDALKALVSGRLNRVFEALDRMATVGEPVLINTTNHVREAAVLAIHSDLQLIILDKGEQHGVTTGSIWNVNNRQKRPLEVQVVSLRPRISAAIIRKGKTDDATPGQLARRQFSEPNNNNPNK